MVRWYALGNEGYPRYWIRLKQQIIISHDTATEITNDIDKLVIEAVPFGECGVVVGPV